MTDVQARWKRTVEARESGVGEQVAVDSTCLRLNSLKVEQHYTQHDTPLLLTNYFVTQHIHKKAWTPEVAAEFLRKFEQ